MGLEEDVGTRWQRESILGSSPKHNITLTSIKVLYIISAIPGSSLFLIII